MELIIKLHEVLNMIKDFTSGYSTKNAGKGYMLIQHKDKRYAVRIVEIEHPFENPIDDIDRLEYLV